MSEQELRTHITERMAAEIEPLLETEKYKGGYDCCGCSTYRSLYEDMLAIVQDTEDDRKDTTNGTP